MNNSDSLGHLSLETWINFEKYPYNPLSQGTNPPIGMQLLIAWFSFDWLIVRPTVQCLLEK
jgi:hypothetical protein